MAEAIWFVFSAPGIVLAVVTATVWLFLAPRSTAPRRFLLGLVIFYWLVSSWAVTYTVASIIAFGYRPLMRADVPPGRTAVVLLGSSSAQVNDWSDNHVALLDHHSVARTLEAVRVFRLLDPSWIVSSGGVVRKERVKPSGLAMSDELVRLGVPADRILVEVDSATTRDEAVIVRSMLASRQIDHVVLVTSAVHMRRSLAAFRAVGVDAIPAISRDPMSVDTWWETVIPTGKGLEEGALAAHEAIGMVYYFARGWATR